MFQKLHRLALLCFLITAFENVVLAAQKSVQVRFIDSETGYAIKPDAVSVDSQILSGVKSGRAMLKLGPGSHVVTVNSAQHQPMSGIVNVGDGSPQKIQFMLDPVVTPKEVSSEHVASLHREGATVFVGYVVDDESGEPMENVSVSSGLDGTRTRTDARGYFRIYVPVKAGRNGEQANLIFAKPGYQSEQRINLELWSNGDWIYRIRLSRGEGVKFVDENQFRRRTAPSQTEPPPEPTETKDRVDLETSLSSGIHRLSTASSNVTIRVPRNIRVLLSDGVTIQYDTLETYCKHVLPAEWIAGWASYTGGSNCLSAGAVAVRSYAIIKINAASGSGSNDICATTSCQVYGAGGNSSANTAVDYTASYVMISGGAVATTEYSAENNSLANSCGDGFTEPSTTGPVCIFDPVCTGETRNGHGRGMCQWGSAKWATGLKFPGNSTSDHTTLNAYPRRDWTWICRHYYPTLTLVKGAALAIGDDIKAVGTVNVNLCVDGSISNGYNCTLITTKPNGTTGTITDGPQQITVDGRGFTWYKITWSDSTVGWSKENYIERNYGLYLPTTPTNLTATAVATNQINLTWNDTTDVENSFDVQRAISTNGPWILLTNIFAANVTNYSDKNLYPSSTWHYRVRAVNVGGSSAFSNTNNATTIGIAPTMNAIGNQTINEGSTLTVTNSASAQDFVLLITDFENFATEGSNGVVMFRDPRNSVTTSANIDATPNLAVIADTNASTSSHMLRVNCNFTNANAPWLRLTTASAANLPNPVIDFTKKLRFKIWSDKTIQIAVGCRETTTSAGTAIGSDGGTTGSSIEWAGVTNKNGTTPIPNRAISANTWTTLTFDFTNEPVMSFSGGNGVLSTASGLGVLEHLAIVPTAGTGAYNIYLDDFAVLKPKTLTYSLDVSPSGMTIDSLTGAISWTPTESQGPGVSNVTVRVTDNNSPALFTPKSFTVTVNEVNTAPMLNVPPTQTINEGGTLTATNTASDADIPANRLTFGLVSGLGGLTLNTNTGVVTWTTTESLGPSTNTVTVRVFDNGSPSLATTNSFTVIVNEVNSAPALAAISNQTATINQPFSITNSASDPDIPTNTLTFSLVSAPDGMTINTNTGLISWTPASNQSGTTNSVTVRVTDNGSPALSDDKTFTVTVVGNQSPVLASINDRTIHIGGTVAFSSSATDPDTNSITFSLDTGAPPDATIDPTNGVFNWTTTNATVGGVSNITVRATDNGVPPASDAKTFSVTIISQIVIQSISVSNNATATFTWNSAPGATYRAQYKTNIAQTGWLDSAPDVTAAGATASRTENIAAGLQRYYRVTLVNY